MEQLEEQYVLFVAGQWRHYLTFLVRTLRLRKYQYLEFCVRYCIVSIYYYDI